MNRPRLPKPLPLSPVQTDPAPPGLSSETTIEIDGEKLKIRAVELEKLKEIGRGQYGRVEKMLHRPTQRILAVKLITLLNEHVNRSQIQRELEVGYQTTSPCVLMCYGGLIHDSEVFILMELMDTSLENLRAQVYGANKSIPESLLAYMTQRVVTGLQFLRREKSIIHRDVKPSNMLANRQGLVKVCDFGVSGKLMKSFALSNVGSNRYLAPERINPQTDQAFSILSDVWSLGLSVMELATGELCYADTNSLFQQLDRVVKGDPLRLPTDGRFSEALQDFISRCLMKKESDRADYVQLLESDFLRSVDVAAGQKQLSEFLPQFIDGNAT
ncbi:dual specificity mitogen-activated protein kinase kinase 6 [Clonorchis sinensis]|uniref:mitogen-activated protein kinase kinase n=1 Tax=Clonorchis sinensis TaxID=79923 RepID=G7YF87_CLOSI|nr:dual specificity mitogen-activated protein kinase kinase 6 [Clonorchis sinensis]